MLNNRAEYKSGSLLLMFFLAIITVNGQEGFSPMKDIDAFRQNMRKASIETQSITSEFVQQKHLDFLEEDVISEGLFYFEKEDKLRWEYSIPFYYLIIFNADSVIISNNEKTNSFNASSGRMFAEISNIMLSMVDGSILNSKNFEFAYFENPDAYILELIPQEANMMEFLSKVRIFISKENYTAEELFMMERSGDHTRIQFISKRLNEDIPDHIFELP